jgi:hypothetical protein
MGDTFFMRQDRLEPANEAFADALSRDEEVVHADPPSPGAEAALATEGAEVGDDLDEDLLRGVLGVRRVAEHAQRETEQVVLERHDQAGDRPRSPPRPRRAKSSSVSVVISWPPIEWSEA